jgi:hypothetical protein
MSLLLKIVDGQPVDHPADENNLLQYYTEIPSEYKPFLRVEKPNNGPYVIYPEFPEYKLVDGFWTDVWTPLTLTQEQIDEITANLTKVNYAKRDNFINIANTQISTLTDENQIQVWQNYIAQLQAWQMQTAYPLTPAFPKMPKQVDGIWVPR